MPEGYVVLVLHCHLPYVLSHGKWPHGSDWLCEAASETYLPLLNLIGGLQGRGLSARFTVGITPVLCEMLASPLFPPTFKEYLGEKIRAAAFDRQSFVDKGDVVMAALAEGWQSFYESRLTDFTDLYKEDLPAAFRQFQDDGQVEIITSAATHAYLPLLDLDSAINAQIAEGVASYKKHFLRAPRGMWLPECAYRPESHGPDGRVRPGLEAFLAAQGLKYFFVDGRCVCRQSEDRSGYAVYVESGLEMKGVRGPYISRDIALGSGPAGSKTALAGADDDRALLFPEEDLSVYEIYKTGRPGEDAAFFIRDGATSQQVWSADRGYPGDPFYLEFHKKHTPGGLRYWRVTDRQADLGAKQVYEPKKAAGRIEEHARHFAGVVQRKLQAYHEQTGRSGVLTIPFDAELFGHWWFEGMTWLGALVSAFDANYVTIEKASSALNRIVPLGPVGLPEGSWGEGGRHFIWHNEETAFTWRYLHGAEAHMERAAQKAGNDEVSDRLLKQMARELLLMQSSDWQFLISTKTAGDYGRSRFDGHCRAFRGLKDMLDRYGKRGTLSDRDQQRLRLLEEQDALFDAINLEWFKERTEDGL